MDEGLTTFPRRSQSRTDVGPGIGAAWPGVIGTNAGPSLAHRCNTPAMKQFILRWAVCRDPLACMRLRRGTCRRKHCRGPIPRGAGRTGPSGHQGGPGDKGPPATLPGGLDANLVARVNSLEASIALMEQLSGDVQTLRAEISGLPPTPFSCNPVTVVEYRPSMLGAVGTYDFYGVRVCKAP